MIDKTKTKTIVLGGGCFWCFEAIYTQIKGVKVISGYAGGLTKNPSYEEICGGKTRHAEVVKVTYKPIDISLEKILEIFFQMHDPTTLNRQGNDIGTQYRSIILYTNPEEKEIIQMAIQKAEKIWKKTIVTEVKQLEEFYPAEDYHQQYYEKNTNQGYCQLIIKPKLEKMKKEVLPKLELMQKIDY